MEVLEVTKDFPYGCITDVGLEKNSQLDDVILLTVPDDIRAQISSSTDLGKLFYSPDQSGGELNGETGEGADGSRLSPVEANGLMCIPTVLR